MKHPHSVLAGLAGVALAVTSCTPSDAEPAGGGSEEKLLLISDEHRDGVDGPQALFEGTLTLTEENCVVGEANDGTMVNLDFPAGTIISPDDPNIVVMNFGELRIGDDVSLGGGGVGSPSVEDALAQFPEACRFSYVFGIYTLA